MHAPLSHLPAPLVRWTINPDEVAQAIAPLDDGDRDALAWLDGYARKHNLTPTELGARLQKANGSCYSKDTVYQILTGREKSIAAFVGSVQRFRLSAITSPSDFPFVETSVWRSIRGYAQLVRQWRKMGLVIAESQTGKSRSFKECASRIRADGGDVVYFQMPTGGHKSKVIEAIAETRQINVSYSTGKQERLIEQSITPDTFFMIDEIQQCDCRSLMGGRTRTERVDTIEYIRRLRDVRGCPVLMSGTTEALRMLRGEGIGHTNKHIFIQTLKRSLVPLELPNNPPRRDLNAFADHVKLEPAKGEALELQDRIAVTHGLEMWLTYLLAGVERARHEDRKVTWTDVIDAYETFVPKKVKE